MELGDGDKTSESEPKDLQSVLREEYALAGDRANLAREIVDGRTGIWRKSSIGRFIAPPVELRDTQIDITDPYNSPSEDLLLEEVRAREIQQVLERIAARVGVNLTDEQTPDNK